MPYKSKWFPLTRVSYVGYAMLWHLYPLEQRWHCCLMESGFVLNINLAFVSKILFNMTESSCLHYLTSYVSLSENYSFFKKKMCWGSSEKIVNVCFFYYLMLRIGLYESFIWMYSAHIWLWSFTHNSSLAGYRDPWWWNIELQPWNFEKVHKKKNCHHLLTLKLF